MSLVLELQQLAWDNANNLPDLLKKAYAVAYKLGLSSFKAWADCEMNGYRGKKKVPPYREVHGRVVCLNPYNGWIPYIMQGAPELQATLSSHMLRTPVGVLQEFVQRGETRSILDYPPEVEQFLMQNMDYPFRPALEVPCSAYVMILDTVRNTILNWSLKLEEDGILGEGLDLQQGGEEDRSGQGSRASPPDRHPDQQQQ